MLLVQKRNDESSLQSTRLGQRVLFRVPHPFTLYTLVFVQKILTAEKDPFYTGYHSETAV